MDIFIKQLSKNTLDSFLYFFDKVAFSDNPAWDGCYCVFFHHDKDEKDWLSNKKSGNRNTAIQLIQSNVMKGFLAFHDSEPVGWVNVNKKTVFSFNKNRKDVYSDSDGDTVSIVCFIVAADYRRKGIGEKLLKHTINHYRASEFLYLEAYPAIFPLNDAENYHGPLNLFLKNNFKITKTIKHYHVVTYKLK